MDGLCEIEIRLFSKKKQILFFLCIGKSFTDYGWTTSMFLFIYIYLQENIQSILSWHGRNKYNMYNKLERE